MKLAGYLGLGLALALVSTSAPAFQEEGGAAVVAPTAPEVNAAPVDPGLEFSAPPVDSTSVGTEVRIPGLGRLGVLPKMDFGLELLYGANDSKKAQPELPAGSDDLTIRGTVKHNF